MPMYLGQDDAGTSSYSLQDFEPSWGTKMNAAVRESWLESYGPAATDYLRSRVSQGDEAKLSAVDAANEIKQSGVKLKKSVGDGQYTKTQLAVLLERQRELTAIKDVRERTPWDMSSPIRGVGMFGAGIADPINLATAFVPWTKPIVGGFRAALMAESFATRTLARAAIGGADAGISTAVLEPAYSYVRNAIGDDYGALDSMANIAFGTAFGGGLHVLGGSVGDAFKMRKGGMVTPSPIAEPIAPPPGTVSGGETRIRIGETYEPARWSVIDADQLTATVDKADNQFRDRTRAAYQTEIQQRANNIDFNLLADSPVMDYGAPTLAADGRIIGGNGRALFISRAYEIGKGNDYRAGLEARMVEMGIDPDAVRGMSKPVLVRVLQRQVDVKRAAMLSNEGGSTDMSPLEQAKVDAERLGDARLQVSADGALDAPENRAAIRRWVEAQPENKRNGLVDEDGKLSATGIQRLNGALLFQAYGDSPVLGRLIESMDPGSRNLAAALGRTAPVLANARGAIATGDLHPLDIAGDIQLAVEKFNALRESGMRVDDYLAQLDAFETGMTPESLALLDFMGRNIASPRRMADAITGFYDRLTEAGNPKQADMFGAGAVPDKAAMLDASIRAAEQGVDTAAEVVVGVAPETREATLRASVAQSVDGRMVEVDAIVGMDESLNTASRADALAAADRNFQPEAVALADFDASADVQARVDAAPKWEGVKDAETALADADAMLADTVKSGDAAFRYSRGDAPGQKKATLWQGSTARFGAEEGAPLGRFRWDFINSEGGEQAQAFGYGHYLAQQAWISQTRYRERLVKMRSGASSSYSIPDGAGGMMTLSSSNDPAWQLADGTIVHTSQKDLKLAAAARAAAQIEGYGYARARTTFENLLRMEREALARVQDARAKFDAGEIGGNSADFDKRIVEAQDRVAAEEANLAALDDVTVDGDGGRVLAPGIQKYTPPVPENMRTRVMADGEELGQGILTVVRQLSDKGALLEDGAGLVQTIGRDLNEVQMDVSGRNQTFSVVDVITALDQSAELRAFNNAEVDAFVSQLRDLQARGVDSLTMERPGSLYRAEMSGVDFQNLMLWNEPLSAQPEKVRKAFERFGIVDLDENTGAVGYEFLQTSIEEGSFNDALGEAIMSAHNEIARRRFSGYPDPVEAMDNSGYQPGSDEVASVILNQAGVPGHAFLDGNSRGATDTPGYNLVIYGDDVAKIVDRYARQTGEIGRATDTAEGLTEAIRLSFGKSTEALLNAGRIKVVNTVDEIPGGPHPRDVHGATDRLGNVYIVAENATEADIKGLVLHEVGVHAGMEKMLGPKLFDEILTELDDAILRGEEWAIRAKSYVPEKTPADMVREEQLAYLVQSAPDLPISKRIIAAVRAWFYRNFESVRARMTLTEGDFQALAVSALRYSGRWADLHADMMTHYARAGNMEDYSRGAVVEGQRMMEFLKSWVWGRKGKASDVYDTPSDRVIWELRKYAPASGELNLFRAKIKGSPDGDFESWTPDRDLAQNLVDDSGGPTPERVLVERTVSAQDVLFDTRLFNDFMRSERGVEVSWDEVVVANGAMADKVREVRAKNGGIGRFQGDSIGYSRAGGAPDQFRRFAGENRQYVEEGLRRRLANASSDFEIREVPLDSVRLQQMGEDYLNDSSRYTAQKIRQGMAAARRPEDVFPVLLSNDGTLVDGHHRHAAATINGETSILALVPVKPGSGQVLNLDQFASGDQAGMRYSRGDVPDPSTAKDELKPYDDAVKRAKGYAGVLRAAADKLENDAQATAAMRAAMPDISPAEITDLLDQLRRQVKGLRGVARTARTMMGAEDVAAGLQTEAMKAADTLANNLEMAAVIEKRNAALNMNARLKAASYINQFREAKLDFEGFRGLLVGTERKRAGGRISVEAEQKNFRGEWLGGMIADLEKGDLMRQFTSGDFDRDVSVALHNMGKGLDNSKLSPEAVKIAEIVNKYQTDARNTRNRFGAWIRDLNGYITRQTHDMFKIRDAGEKAFKEFVLPRLDLQRSLRDFDGTADDFLTRVYDDFAAGSHMKVVAGEDDLQALGRGSSLARRESVSRVLYFKDGNASFEYNQKFGQGRLAETVLGGLEQSAKSAGLMKLLGTNPEATVTRLFDEYAESLRGDPARRAKFLERRGELENLLSHVDGRANIPGDVTAAKISSFVRSWVSMTKLGGALISSITDLSNYAAELRFGQDKNLLSGTLEGIGALTQGRASGEKKQILSSLGVFHESTLGSVFARFDSPELMGGKTSAAMQTFFKLTGLNWWTETLRDGYALTHSHYLATNSGQSFDKLPEALRDMLGLYNIDAGKWDVLRIATMQEADGRAYMTPEGLKTVPRAALENYITSIGRTVSDASVANLQDDLASALRTMTIDRMHHAVIEPGARTRAFMLRGTKPGTVPGELLRFATQFKSFPVALIQSTLGREVYGRGYDTLGDYLKNGKGDMVGMATFLALSMSMGYAAMSIKDLLKGRNPRPVDDPRTWAAAFVQGGGLGIYGDFLFGKYNRMGGTLSGSLIGPAANLIDTAADLWTRIRTGDDVAGTAFKALIDNTPFMNLFYTRAALDYLVLYKVQEALNPGFLRRMEKRIERENGQTFYLPPTAAL